VSLIMHKSTSLIAVLDWIVYSSEFDCLTCCNLQEARLVGGAT
jgi:hypothetical protein